MLSVVILTHNEEKVLQRALKSVAFADEIVVIDDLSADKTHDVAEKHGARVISHESKGNFAQQRNFGMEIAKGEWILFVDADEVVSEKLTQEVQKTISSSASTQAYKLRRKDYFWGKEVTHGEVATAHDSGIIRLMKRGSGTWKGDIHEEFIPTLRPGVVNGFLDHFPHQTVKEFLQHVNHYSTIRAEELAQKGIKTNWLEIMFYPIGKFLYTYFIKAGFLDGAAGFVYSFMMSFHSFLVRSKLYLKVSRT